MTTEQRKPTLTELADDLEDQQMAELNRRIGRSNLYVLGEYDPSVGRMPDRGGVQPMNLLADDPRLRKMPDKPTLMDFFELRMGSINHMLQSATHALKAGCDEKIVLACLLHDISVVGFIRADHGYWGAQMVEPYVDEEVAWAIRAHQALRFFADEGAGYEYPEMYVRMFGAEYQPEPYIVDAYNKAKAHKWYMTARQITINDIYSFDPDAKPQLEDFYDIIGRHFRQPEEGLGFDGSPVAHMWRTLMWPTRSL